MTSKDGDIGIKLDEFLKMWTADGTQLIEQDKADLNGSIWLLYSIYFPESTEDYGRHMAMILKVDRQTNIILMHDLENLSGSAIGGGHRDLKDWFEKHKGKY